MLQVFLDMGANADERFGPNNETALFLAATKDKDKVVKVLIEHGADVEALNMYDPVNGSISALMVASFLGHFASKEILVDLGAKVNATDANGNTAHYWEIEGSKQKLFGLIYGSRLFT